jgi:hypothetical protein
MGKRSDLIDEVITKLKSYDKIDVLAPQEKPKEKKPYASISLYSPTREIACYGITIGLNISVVSCTASTTEKEASDLEDWIENLPEYKVAYTLENSVVGLTPIATDEWVRQLNLIVFKGK